MAGDFYILTDVPDRYTKLEELLIQQGWSVRVVNMSVDLSIQLCKIFDSNTNSCLSILCPEAHRFNVTDFKLIRELVEAGTSLIVAGGDEETAASVAANLNQLSSTYGVKFRKNSIIRPNPYKQYHPKEVMLNDFVVNRSFSQLIEKHYSAHSSSNELPALLGIEGGSSAVRVLYAHGCSLEVDDDSAVIMTSSNFAIPPNQAICTFSGGLSKSKVIVLGSASSINNSYVECENNTALVMALLDICRDENFSINLSDARTLELPEMVYTGDMKTLIDVPLPCFETLKPLPENKADLIERHLFNLDCSKLALVVDAYAQLGVPNEPLTLLRPQFKCRFMELEPATHGFILRRPKDKTDQFD